MTEFPVVEHATVDPNGDTLLIIKDPRWKLPTWKTNPLAPEGYTDSDEEQSEIDEATEYVENDLLSKPDEVHVLVSSRQLRIVSRYFDNMFKGGYIETQLHPDGKYHISANGWNPGALTLAMNIAHVQLKAIPETIDLTGLVELTVVADYYDMEPTVASYTQRWAKQLLAGPDVKEYGEESMLRMYLAAKYKDAWVLDWTATLAMKWSMGAIQDLDLPFPRNIIGMYSTSIMRYLGTR
jgi:hypothetical protein